MMADWPFGITCYLMLFLGVIFVVDQHQRFVYSSSKIDESPIDKDALKPLEESILLKYKLFFLKVPAL